MACFRVYASLNDFLEPHRRGCRFRHSIRGVASLKDGVEAVGIPHPEVELVLVNGVDVGWSHRICDADDVAVYPRFRSIPLEGLCRAGEQWPDPPRFVVDAHLRKLGSWLRLAGLDALVVGADEEVAVIAATEGRVALTRDRQLLKRSVIRHGHWVRQTDPEGQLREVVAQFELSGRVAPFTRCLVCNARLAPVDKADIADRLPPDVLTRFDDLRRCDTCDRIYWRGSHYERLCGVLERTTGWGGDHEQPGVSGRRRDDRQGRGSDSPAPE